MTLKFLGISGLFSVRALNQVVIPGIWVALAAILIDETRHLEKRFILTPFILTPFGSSVD